MLLVVGGALYTVGLIFHLWERLPFQNAIWHGFVVAAAATHFAAIVISVAAPAGPPESRRVNRRGPRLSGWHGKPRHAIIQ